MSFLPAKSADDVIRRQRADELRAETTFGLMGRMPDFMNAVVTDVALGMRDHSTSTPLTSRTFSGISETVVPTTGV